MKVELDAGATIVSVWKEYFDAEKAQQDRRDAASSLKLLASTPSEFAVCNSLCVGDVWQVLDDVTRNRLPASKALELAEEASRLGLLHTFKFDQLKSAIDGR